MDKHEGKVIVMHGMSQDDALKAMRAVKLALDDKGDIAFAMSTESNLSWSLSYLVEHIREEHDQMTGKTKS